MKAIITAPFHRRGVEILSKHMDVTLSGWGQTQKELTEDELISAAKGCEILITEVEDITARVINSCPDLKLIGCTRAVLEMSMSMQRPRRVFRVPCTGPKCSGSRRAYSASHDRCRS